MITTDQIGPFACVEYDEQGRGQGDVGHRNQDVREVVSDLPQHDVQARQEGLPELISDAERLDVAGQRRRLHLGHGGLGRRHEVHDSGRDQRRRERKAGPRAWPQP